MGFSESSDTARLQPEPPAHVCGDEGHVDAVGEFFNTHRTGLVRLSCAIVRCPHDADDVVQEVFLRLLERGHVPRDLSPGYVARSVANASLDLLRRRTARAQAMEGWYHEGLRREAARYTDAEVNDTMETLPPLHELPPRQRTVLEKIYFEGLSPQEVAGQLGIRQGTVIDLCYRARRRLRELSRDRERRE
ncbi:MAG: hypothetical protein AMXMBFR53_23490 [Gemmatimonadota bacterium]